jgi:hypothetical protein
MGRDGNGYLCMAADGSVRTLQGWRLFPVKSIEGYKMYPSFGVKNGIIKEVIGQSGKKFRVRWLMPNREDDITLQTKANIIQQHNICFIMRWSASCVFRRRVVFQGSLVYIIR